jgi:hypothetical protein
MFRAPLNLRCSDSRALLPLGILGAIGSVAWRVASTALMPACMKMGYSWGAAPHLTPRMLWVVGAVTAAGPPR